MLSSFTRPWYLFFRAPIKICDYILFAYLILSPLLLIDHELKEGREHIFFYPYWIRTYNMIVPIVQ